MPERLVKIALVAAIALYLGIVVLNNLTDYGSNFEFVRHVLSMDTTFPDNRLKWRALTSPVIHHVFYATIILWESASTVALAVGAWKLWHKRQAPAAEFNAAKSFAVGALGFNLLLWFVAFLCVGGEWFVMWQSQIWNGQSAAFRMFACIGIVLLFLRTPDTDL